MISAILKCQENIEEGAWEIREGFDKEKILSRILPDKFESLERERECVLGERVWKRLKLGKNNASYIVDIPWDGIMRNDGKLQLAEMYAVWKGVTDNTGKVVWATF